MLAKVGGRGYVLLHVAEVAEHPGTFRKVDRPPVIWIHETKVPELRSLVEVGNARRPDLQYNLRQRVEHPVP
jgi:hypothetical protein